MIYNKYARVTIIICAVILAIIIAISAATALTIAYESKLEFCFSPGCFNFAAKALEEPIKIFKIGIEFGTYAFAAIGAATAIMTYLHTVKAAKANQHYQKSSDFKDYISKFTSSANSGIKDENFNSNQYYNFLFSNSINAVFSPSTAYRDTIELISKQITNTSTNYTPGDKTIITKHFTNMTTLLNTLGINLEEPTELKLILLEPKIFSFIDNINKQFTDIELRLQHLTREYERHK